MTATATQTPKRRPAAPVRRLGYLVAMAVHAVLLVVVNNIVEWDVLPFLTAEFDSVVPIISASLWAGILVNAVWVAYDPRWVRSLGDLITGAVSLLAAVRMLQVFPFDFAASEFPWEMVARVVLIAAIVGVVIGMVVSTMTLVRFAITGKDGPVSVPTSSKRDL